MPTRGKQTAKGNPESLTIKSYAQTISVQNGFDVLQPTVVVLATSPFPNDGGDTSSNN